MGKNTVEGYRKCEMMKFNFTPYIYLYFSYKGKILKKSMGVTEYQGNEDMIDAEKLKIEVIIKFQEIDESLMIH